MKDGETIKPRSVSTIIRYHAPERSHELELALFSLFNQKCTNIEVIIACQNFKFDEQRLLEKMVAKYDWATRHSPPRIINVAAPEGLDIRSKLLNSGIAVSTGRFIAFLDFDDLLYSHAYKHLIDIAERSGAAVVFGGITVKHNYVANNFAYNLKKIDDYFSGSSISDLVKCNFCPIHSYILDRHKIDQNDLWFDETLTRLEDHDFLLRLAKKYSLCFDGLNRKIGIYNHHIDGSNTVQIFDSSTPENEANSREWRRAREHLENQKKYFFESGRF